MRLVARIAVAAGFIMFTPLAMAQSNDPIVTESTSTSTVTTQSESYTENKSETETTVKSPPNTAVAPGININNSDLCTVGVSGAVQTQILGISGGSTVRDMNCERLKNAKTLYDMGMKVAAVSIMCQDDRVFRAMKMAGTPCPYEGKIGKEAKKLWDKNPEMKPETEGEKNEKSFLAGLSIGTIIGLLLLL
jgi:hypothetical protein